MDITVEHFREYHYKHGEDFFDQTGEGNHLIFGGFLMARFPDLSAEILEVCNSKFGECLNYASIDGLDYDEDLDIDRVYVHFADFVNQTGALKQRVSALLGL